MFDQLSTGPQPIRPCAAVYGWYGGGTGTSPQRRGTRRCRYPFVADGEEAVIFAFRQHVLLPLDDCLYALQATIPPLTRSSLHRCLQRHGVSPASGGRGRQGAEEAVQALSDRLLPHRHRILTDNGIQFPLPPRYASGPTARYITRMFAMRCRENDVEHRFTKINHPWTRSSG